MYPKIYNYICIYIHNTIIIYSHYIPSIWLPYFGDILEPLQLIIISIVSPFIFFSAHDISIIFLVYFFADPSLIQLWKISKKRHPSEGMTRWSRSATNAWQVCMRQAFYGAVAGAYGFVKITKIRQCLKEPICQCLCCVFQTAYVYLPKRSLKCGEN